MKQRAVIGIEVSQNEIRGACVKAAGPSAQLSAVASVPTPPNAFDNEGLLNSHVVGEAIRKVCAQLDPKERNVVLGVTGCDLVARIMEIPPVPDSEVRAVLRGEMDHYRILPAGQSAFDFYRLPDLPEREHAQQDGPVARVLLMGAEERLISSYRAAGDHAGANPTAVEPGSIAVLRALFPMLAAEEAVATIILSASGTDIFITRRGDLQFYRRVDTGVPELHTTASGPTASGPARTGLLMSNAEQDDEADAGSQARDPLNRQAISLLGTEIQRSLDYYAREFPLPEGAQMVVRFAIDAPDATDLMEAISQYLRTEAEMASVIDTVPLAPETVSMLRGTDGFRYVVAVGLAMRSAGGAYGAAPALDLSVGDRVIVERRATPRAMVASFAFSGVVLLVTVGVSIVLGGYIDRAERDLAQRKHELDALTQEHAARVEVLNRQTNLVAAIHHRDKPVRDAVDFLASAVTKQASLSTLAIQSDGAIQLSGDAQSPRVVADIMDTVNVSPVLEPIRLNSLARASDPQDTTLHFEMQSGFLKPAAPAKPE